jgi:hypothetical protein
LRGFSGGSGFRGFNGWIPVGFFASTHGIVRAFVSNVGYYRALPSYIKHLASDDGSSGVIQRETPIFGQAVN